MKFYDTCSLLEFGKEIFKQETSFLISSVTLTELENIKRSATKDEETKWQAREVLRLLLKHSNKYDVILYTTILQNRYNTFCLPDTNDSKIILTVLAAMDKYTNHITFVTQDLACKAIAEGVGITTQYLTKEEKNDYTGFKKIQFNDNELNDFYSYILPNNENLFNLLTNEYLLIEYQGNIEDKYKWAGDHYEKIPFYKIESKMFGKIAPKDIYQQLAIDSLYNNQLTVLRGKPGSGKSYLGLSYLISLLEKGQIDSIVILTNTVAVRGAAKLGYYPGDKNSKLLDSQIGNFLASKFGSITEVERMIDHGTLTLLPTSDIRGVDLSGMQCGVLCTEAQNTSIDMMKLMLQRIGEDSVCVFEGDDKSQVDMQEYVGKNNGLRRLSEVFRGHSLYGEVNLQQIHRSEITRLAEEM